MKQIKSKEKALRELRRIVSGRVNDAVKLLFLEEESSVDALDLSMVSELRRASNGTVEVKFIDRLKAIELLMAESESENAGPGATEMLCSAIEKAANAEWEDSE